MPIIPRNPFERSCGPDSSAIAKQVFRLLRSCGYPSVHRPVAITPDLVEQVTSLINHTGRVHVVAGSLAVASDVDWSGLEGMALDPPEILDAAFHELAGRHLGKSVRFDATLIAEIHEAVQGAYYRDFLEEILTADPVSALEFYHRGNARCEAGSHESAIKDYTVAIALDPMEPLFFRARSACLLNDLGDALSANIDARRACELVDVWIRPMDLQSFVLKARVAAALGEGEEAVRCLMEFSRDAREIIRVASWDNEGMGTMTNGVTFNAECIREEVLQARQILCRCPSVEGKRSLRKALTRLSGIL